MEPALLSRIDAGVLWLTLNRPKARNALSDELRTLLFEAVRTAALDPGVRAVVIRGAGGAFCAGADVAQLGIGQAGTAAMLERGREIVTALAELPKPVVAAVQGPAAGAGFSLALACDLIVADDSAVFHPVFAKVGLAPDWAFTHWFVRTLGLHRAKDILLTGRALPAAEAHDLGLVARHWPTAEFEENLRAFAMSLADGPTVALGVTKRLLNEAVETDLAGSLTAEAYAALYVTGSADHAEAVAAFAEKRPARFEGH
ncbi:enoyl-CoA hydratase-related protein [Sporichthya sp.]|uniref:enoyl-CoA hydratase-related protein n=1 Tax=Sporichthya sp. TaxID=65475 RepID=UPI00185CCC1B|nr:enoyl-CoA hydratase-related protein [Sporichthya sp.]MBA3745594.1 enoyl-CoA hydratase/isomerase family protein [Sporichthya sp.]